MPSLQGFHLVARNYQPLQATSLPDGTLSLHSTVLNLDLRLEDGRLRFYDAATGQRLLTYQEADQARRVAQERVERETLARQAAEARVAELEARLRALQADDPGSPPADS